MQFASKPTRFDEPGECIVIPGRTYDENGGVLLDGIYDGRNGDMHLWMSFAGLQSIVRQFGKRLNVAPYDLFEDRADRVIALEAELEQVKAARDDLQDKLDRINGLSKEGFKVERQRGPAPTARKQKAAH